ncbi:MAG: polysulfide reductase NrfD, partial [Chloroflexota bacterium]|nr:polysulfide reductase NrfD [Chloroflexota bacterium]
SWLWANVGETAYTPQDWLDGPIQRSGSFASGLVQTVYDVPHAIPWGWKVSTYLWTKSIGAGAFFVPALLLGFGAQLPNLFATLAAFVSLVFIGITTFFLVWDLKQPLRFLKIVFRAQKRSWLALGAFVLMAYTALGGMWLLAGAGQVDWVRGVIALPLDALRIAQAILNFPTAILAILSAIYSAFLFSQAEGRDLWQSPLLPLNLFLHATIAGSGALLIVNALFAPSVGMIFVHVFVAGIVALLVTQLLGDFAIRPSTTNAAQGHHFMTHGHYGRFFWGGTIALALGLMFAVVGIALSSTLFGALGGAVALVGLLAVEHAWVQAGQLVPNS